MACNEREKAVQDKLKITPAMSKAFMEEALNHVMAGKSTPEVFQAMADRTGLNVETVARVLQQDTKLFSIAKQALIRQNAARGLKVAAKQLAEYGPEQGGAIQQSWDSLRRIALAGHSTVFPFTHLRNLLYGNKFERQIFRQAAADAWRYRGEKGAALHEMDMALLKLGDHYEPFKSWGLDIGEQIRPGDVVLPGQGQSRIAEYIRNTATAKFLRIDPRNAARSLDALKIARYKLMKLYWDATDPALKSPEYGQLLARDMNYATGSVMEPRGAASTAFDRTVASASKASRSILLASKLFYAKRMESFNLIRYGSQLLLKGGRMTAAERAIANLSLRRWARIAGTQIGILGVNAALAKAFGLQLPNFTDPSKANFMRMRIGNFVVPLSPLLEVAREPIRAITTTLKTRSIYEGGKEAVRPVINALHPAASLLLEQSTGKEAFSGRPIPSVRNVVQPVVSKRPPEGAGEYISTRFSPIAISGALREYYQALRDEGVGALDSTAFIKGAAGGLTSGLAGTHVYEESPQKSTGEPSYGRVKQRRERRVIR